MRSYSIDRTCPKCIHFDMCKQIVHPFDEGLSGGFPAINFSEYREEWYRIQAQHCARYKFNNMEEKK